MGQDDEDNRAASLPEDLLADILGRLAPRCLAVSRGVCKAWQATIDARRLLHAYYSQLPHRLEGILLYFTWHKFPEFFSRPGAPITAGEMDFLPSANENMEDDLCEIQDHCNGLLLLQDKQTGIPNYVVNPATRRWDPVPDRPPGVSCWGSVYLVYDPMVSLHYEVFMIPSLPYNRDYKRKCYLDPLLEESEWPPATCTMHVFSSRTRCWEPRSFDREGDALGTIAEMRTRGKLTSSSWWWMRCRAVYWRATLYVHSDGNFLMSISLSNGMFRAIELPEGAISSKYTTLYLGRSEKGVYFASLDNSKLRVWILDESCGKIQWMLKHEHGLVLPRNEFGRPGPWVLQDMNYNFFWHRMPYIYRNEEAVLDEQDFDWSSDDDWNVATNRDMDKECFGNIVILGFHPFKEIIFLLLDGRSVKTPLAYHYNSLKAEVLGNVEPTGYEGVFILPNDARTIEGFPYVPCWLEEFPTNTTQSRSS